MKSLSICLVLALPACGSSAPPPTDPAPPAATEPTPAPQPAHLAPPFDAAALQAGLPAGTELKLRITAAGQPTVIQHWVFTASDASGCTIHARILGEDGVTLIKDEGEGTSTWAELESHALFPAALTTRTDSSVDVEAGHFETWLFEVRPAERGGPIKKLHFARTLPGPPVLMQVIDQGTGGEQVTMTMELVSRTQPE